MYIKVCSRLVLGLTQMMTNDKSANELPRESQNVLTNGSKELIVGPLLHSARKLSKTIKTKKHGISIRFFSFSWRSICIYIRNTSIFHYVKYYRKFEEFFFLFDSLTKGVTTELWLPTCVSVILVMMASMIFSPLVGYGFFLCSLSQAFKVAVDSLVAFFLLAAKSPYPP